MKKKKTDLSRVDGECDAPTARSTAQSATSDVPSSVKHTPGPWVATTDDAPLYVSPLGRGDDPVICDLVPRDADVFTDEDEANARLIAAAPELLATCKELREALCGAMRVIAGIDQARLLGIEADNYSQRFVDEMKIIGLENGFGVRAHDVIAKADPAWGERAKAEGTK